MKVGFFIYHRLAGKGGIENVLKATIAQLKKEGIDSTLFFWEEPIYHDFFDSFNSSFIIQKNESDKYHYLPKFIKKFLIKRDNASLLRSFFYKNVLPLNLNALIVIDLPDTLLFFKSTLKLCKEHKIPIISWIHGSLLQSTPKQIKRTKNILSYFTHHLTVSKGIAKELHNIYKINNVTTIINPIKQSKIIPRSNKNKFIYIGRIGDPRKQIDKTLKALQKLKGDWSLEIIGSTGSSIKDSLFIEKLKLLELDQNITFYGWKEDPWSIIKEADLLLLNSSSEGFPLVLLEAMSRGVPCLSSDCPTGPNEIIVPNKNGWLFEVDNEEKMINILQDIINKKITLPNIDSVKESIQKLDSYKFEEFIKNTINNYY